jgi:uncharacterized protein YbjT (DUF2867 family)
MKVLAVGATGASAGLVVPELLSRGVIVRALVRDLNRADAARARGVQEIAVGDLTDSASLRAAADGVDGVFHLNPAFAPDEAAMGVAMVRAAVDAGVRKFVFSSVYHPSISLTNHAGKRPVEEAVYDSGMDFTVLQPAMFLQMLDGAWRSAQQLGRIAMPYSKHARACYVDYRDVAEAAALAMTGDTLSQGTFELSAPGMVNRVELAELMSRVLGRTVVAEEPSFADWAQQAHLPPGPVRDGLERMNADYDAHGFPGGNALVLRAVLGREPRTLPEYIAELAQR